MQNNAIPVYQPSLKGNEKKYLNECIDSGWISSKGKFVDLFEKQFSDYVGVSHATSVCNGTVALHLALLALGIGSGDEVILPTLTYVACANAISYVQATPIFVDSLPGSWQMDPEDVIRKITPKTKAIMAVHLYGHPCELTQLSEIAKQHGLFLIEDCAEAMGSFYKKKHVGSMSDIATFSFFGNKTITTGEGGMVVTQNPDLFRLCQRLKAQGVSADRQYWHDLIAYNYRMPNTCAAIGLAQLENIENLLHKKRMLVQKYRKLLQGLPVSGHEEDPQVSHSYWMFSILVEKGQDRDPLRHHLAENGIETRPLFYPVHTLPMYQTQDDHPVAQDLSARGINLPSWPDLSDEQIERIGQCVQSFYHEVLV